MSNSIVKDNKNKKFMSPSKRLWKNLVSTLHSKLNPLRTSQSRKTTCRLTSTISSPQHHHHHHHHYHHHYYHHHPQPSDHDQKHLDYEKCLFVDNKACATPCSEVVPSNSTNREQHIRTITPDMEFFDADDDDEETEMESERGAIVAADCGDSLLEVDAKAEEFINRRKEAWRLEKQKSEEEYWQMLARGT